MAVSLLTQDDHVDDDDDRSHNDYYELQFPSQVSLHYISSAGPYVLLYILYV